MNVTAHSGKTTAAQWHVSPASLAAGVIAQIKLRSPTALHLVFEVDGRLRTIEWSSVGKQLSICELLINVREVKRCSTAAALLVMWVRQHDRLCNIYYNRDYMMIRTMTRVGSGQWAMCDTPWRSRSGLKLQLLLTRLRKKSLRW